LLAGASFLLPKKKGFARCLIGWLIGGLDSGFVSTGGGFSLDYGYNAGYRVCGLAYGDKVGRERRLTITILSPPYTIIPSLRDIPGDFNKIEPGID
jgi:hypothetical protein